MFPNTLPDFWLITAWCGIAIELSLTTLLCLSILRLAFVPWKPPEPTPIILNDLDPDDPKPQPGQGNAVALHG